jgi:AcrR family transcriptional regulator
VPAAPKPRTKPKTRDRILDASLDLFVEHGVKGTTITMIEQRVGLAAGTGSFYRHFPSKEAVLRAAVQREAELARAAILEARDALPPDHSTEDSLHLIGVHLQEFDRLFMLMLTEGERVPQLHDAMTDTLLASSSGASWKNDPEFVLRMAALGGYHLLTRFQGRPFLDAPFHEFISTLARLELKAP